MATESTPAKKPPESKPVTGKRWDVSAALRRMKDAYGESFRQLAK